jgi:hypothetical protein
MQGDSGAPRPVSDATPGQQPRTGQPSCLIYSGGSAAFGPRRMARRVRKIPESGMGRRHVRCVADRVGGVPDERRVRRDRVSAAVPVFHCGADQSSRICATGATTATGRRMAGTPTACNKRRAIRGGCCALAPAGAGPLLPVACPTRKWPGPFCHCQAAWPKQSRSDERRAARQTGIASAKRPRNDRKPPFHPGRWSTLSRDAWRRKPGSAAAPVRSRAC